MSDLGPTQTLVLRALEGDEEADAVPPWHPYDGCYGCRRGDAVDRKALEKEKWDGSTSTH